MIQSYIDFSNQVDAEEKAQKAINLEKMEFKTPTLAFLKEKFPNSLVKEFKKEDVISPRLTTPKY